MFLASCLKEFINSIISFMEEKRSFDCTSNIALLVSSPVHCESTISLEAMKHPPHFTLDTLKE